MDAIDTCATVLWNSLRTGTVPSSADYLYVFGSTDAIVPAFAAALFFRIQPKLVVCSGGVAHVNDDLNTGWGQPEGEVFGRILEAFGVPKEKILIDSRAQNTAQNFQYSVGLVGDVPLSSNVVVHKPYMTLRTKLTGAVAQPGFQFEVCAPELSYSDYCKTIMPRDRLVNIMVGDFQRIQVYGEKGIAAPHAFDQEAVDAFNRLVEMGFTRRLITAA